VISDTIHYATYFDRHYLSRGLALYRSLCRNSPPFLLYVLCLDADTQRALSHMRLDKLVTIPLEKLEQKDAALLGVKESRRPVEYYWTCTAPLLLYIMAQYPEVDLITYLDADLLFFSDPSPIYRELRDRSILIVEHRYGSPEDPRLETYGKYNVGLLAFRRTALGLACLAWWRERCIEWCFLRMEAGKFGDQRYLEEWPSRFGDVAVLQHRGSGLAPWNVENYELRSDGAQLLVDGEPLVFYHFSNLRIIYRWLYDPDLGRGLSRMARLLKKHVYVPYIRELRAAVDLIRAAGEVPSPVESIRRNGNKPDQLRRALRHRSFLVVTDWFVL
jgi:hypothetical protein